MSDKTIIFRFGYGDLGISPLHTNVGFVIEPYKTPHECGTKVKDADFTGERYEIVLYETGGDCDIDFYNHFMRLLLRVADREINTFQIDDYFFDFNNFNIESLRVIVDNIRISAIANGIWVAG